MNWHDWLVDPRSWVSLLAALGGWLSAALAWRNGRTTRSQLKLARTQDARKTEKLDVHLIESFCEVSTDWRRYAFSILIRNPSELTNSVAEMELIVNYRSQTGLPLAVRIPYKHDTITTGPQSLHNTIEPPVEVGGGKTIRGTAIFEVPRDMFTRENKIDDYILSIVDVHESAVVASALHVREIMMEESDGEGR